VRVKVILCLVGLALAVASIGCSARHDPVYIEAFLNEPVEEKKRAKRDNGKLFCHQRADTAANAFKRVCRL